MKMSEGAGSMDIFSLLLSRLDSYIVRIKELYSYIFRFFLPDYADDGGLFSLNKQNKISL